MRYGRGRGRSKSGFRSKRGRRGGKRIARYAGSRGGIRL